jgi:uncharacterized damage-inducible protein DinB
MFSPWMDEDYLKGRVFVTIATAMENTTTARPDSTEYAEYYGRYISMVPDGNISAILKNQFEATLSFFKTLSEERAEHAYAPGKWTIKEVVGHLMDAERVFAYRALRIGRNDPTPLPGFEENDYVAAANFNKRTLADIVEEFAAVRRATVELFRRFDEREMQRRGTANQKAVSTRAVAYIIAGHELHHTGVIKTRYLSPLH